ncbi:MAG: DUF4013 domain-containing protein [Bacteroidota bacterium]
MQGLAKAFSFPFKDPDWIRKFLVGGLFVLLSALIIGIFILAGYCVRVTQRVMRGEANPLPEWDDIGGKFVAGFKFCVVLAAYSVPIFLVVIPFLVLGILGENLGAGGGSGILRGFAAMFIMLLALPYALLFTVFAPVIAGKFAERESIADALDVADVFRRFGRNWENSLVAALLIAGIQSLAGAGIVLFFVGVVFTVFYSYLVSAHLAGLLLAPEGAV